MFRLLKIIFIYFFIYFFIFFTNAFAAFSVLPAQELSNLIHHMNSMQADFVQNTYDNYQKPIQQSHGRMSLKRPGQFRWQVMKPIPQLMIANQSRLWIYDEDLEQVTIRSLKQAAGETPGLLLSHEDNNIEKDFTITLLKQSTAKKRCFLLVPKKPDSMFASIQICFLNNNLQEMQFEDHLGHRTRIIFNNIKINIPLSASLFIFKSNSHIDVIDETKY
jgi:outer membrane lipoprotein carrier protein